MDETVWRLVGATGASALCAAILDHMQTPMSFLTIEMMLAAFAMGAAFSHPPRRER